MTPAEVLAPQPPPNADSPGLEVWPALIQESRRLMRGHPYAVMYELVLLDCEERHRQGVARYGTPLRMRNGRDPRIDAYQEALDLAAYLYQAFLEGRGDYLLSRVGSAMEIALRLRADLEGVSILEIGEPEPEKKSKKKGGAR